MAVEIRRLGRGDEDVVRRLAEHEPQTTLLADERTIFLAALDGDEPVGFLFGYELPRRHGDPSIFFVYEVEVAEEHRRHGVATRLYARVGGEATRGVVMWDFAWSADA